MQVIPANRDVNRDLDVGFVTRLDLLDKEVAGEVWVPIRKLCVVIDVAVVTPAEASDAIDGGFFERVNEPVGIKLRSDSRNVLGGVKVEVDLPESKLVRHGGFVRLPSWDRESKKR